MNSPFPDVTPIIAELVTPQGIADPYRLYTAARELGPVTSFWGDKLFVVGYEPVRTLLRHPGLGPATADVFVPGLPANFTRRLLGKALIKAHNPHHGRMRAPIAAVYTPKRLAAIEPAIHSAVDRLLDGMADEADGGAVDFIAAFASRLPLDVACELLGAAKDDLDQLRALVSDFSWALELGAGDAELAASEVAARELVDRFSGLLAERRATPRNDVISDLARMADSTSGLLSDEELIANFIMLLVAGSQTVTHWIGNALALVIEHPDVADQVRAGELDAAGFTEEALRYDTSAQIIPRVALHDVDIAGVASLPAGAGILLVLGGANRDPDHYERSEEFDPWRGDPQPLSFGLGVHFCLGAKLSRMQAAAALGHVLSRFPKLAPAGAPVRSNRAVIRGYETFPVSLY